MKFCSKCKEQKDDNSFGIKKGALTSQCKTCINKKRKERYMNNKQTAIDKRWDAMSKKYEENEGVWTENNTFYYIYRIGNKIYKIVEGTQEAKDFLKLINKPEKKTTLHSKKEDIFYYKIIGMELRLLKYMIWKYGKKFIK